MSVEDAVVFVVDDDRAMRESLCWLIESVGLKCKVFASAAAFLQGCDRGACGCLLLDVRMPGIGGMELHARLAAEGVLLPVILITGHGDVSMAVRAMKAGAFDFFEKPFNDQALLECVQRAIAHDYARRERLSRRAAIASRLKSLTPREKQVLDLVVAGRLNKQIAEDLRLSEKTVESHRSNLMRKMRADNVVDLVKMVVDAQAPSQAAANDQA